MKKENQITLKDLKADFLESHEKLKNVRYFYVIPSWEWQALFELKEGKIVYRKYQYNA